MARIVWVVTGYNVGGNSGATIEGIFTRREDAERWALESPHRAYNSAFFNRGVPFEVEEFDLFESFEESRLATQLAT